MKQLKILFYSLPWIMVIILFVIWVIGVQFPGTKSKGSMEVINNTVILERVEELGRMELVRYNYKEIYDYRALSDGKIKGAIEFKTNDFKPDLKVVLIAKGEAVGCIDLRKMKENDIRRKGDSIILHLPDPELCYYKLDHENSRIYDFERSGWWSRLFPDDRETGRVIEKAYREAETQIRKAAIHDGILEETAENAETILKPMLESLTGKSVIFVYTPPEELLSPDK